MHYISGPKGGKILVNNGYHYRYGYKTTQHQVFYCINRNFSTKNKKKCTVQLKIINEAVEVINSHNHEPVEEVKTPNNNDKNTSDNTDSSMPTKSGYVDDLTGKNSTTTSESLNNSNGSNNRNNTEQTAYVLRTRKVMAVKNSIISISKRKNTNYHRNRSHSQPPNKISKPTLIEANCDILENNSEQLKAMSEPRKLSLAAGDYQKIKEVSFSNMEDNVFNPAGIPINHTPEELNTSLKTDINENDQNQIQNEQSKELEKHDFNVDLMDIDNVSLKMENVVKLSETIDTIPDLVDDK